MTEALSPMWRRGVKLSLQGAPPDPGGDRGFIYSQSPRSADNSFHPIASVSGDNDLPSASGELSLLLEQLSCTGKPAWEAEIATGMRIRS